MTSQRRPTDPPFSPGVALMPEDFPRRLTRLKEITGLSWEGLATCLGVDMKQVHRWRQGGEPCGGAVLSLVMVGSCQPLHAGRGQGVVAMTGLLIHASFGGLAARGGPLRNRSGQTL